MPAPAPYFAHGTFEGWEPGLMGSRRAGALDTLRGVFISGTAGLLRDGDQPPDYPGMWIDDVTAEDGGAGTWAYRVSAVGDLDGVRPAKLIGDRRSRSNDPNWDASVREWYHDAAEELAGTTSASTDFITISNGSRIKDGDSVKVLSLDAACGLDAGNTYFARDCTGGGFRLSATLGGAAIDLSGSVGITCVLATFARGTAHPLHPGMFLYSVDTDETSGLPFARVKCDYRGIYGAKPYKRAITVNGRQLTNDNVGAWNFPGGGWTSGARKASVQMPTIMVSDVQAYAVDPNLYEHIPTSDVLNILDETRTIPSGIVIPNPPNLNTLFNTLSGPDTREQWPKWWSFIGCELVDCLPGTTVVLIKKTWSYEWTRTL